MQTTASRPVGRAVGLLVCMGALLAGAVLLIVYAAEELGNGGSPPPEVLLPVIVITGVIALMATLAIAAALFGLFDISDRNQALGLPAGSVQAVIALSLILIFAVVALYASSSVSEQRTVSGLTQAQFEEIPTPQIISRTPEEKDGTVTYTVVQSVEDPAKKDLNTQLLTTVSTLVVAVAGFYFGSKSVQEGNKSTNETILATSAGGRALTLTEPASPYTWEPGQVQLPIKLQATPTDARLQTEVHNDDKYQLTEIRGGNFLYKPSKNVPQPGIVALDFAHADDPTISTTLIVNFPEPGGEAAEVDPVPVDPVPPPEQGPEPETSETADQPVETEVQNPVSRDEAMHQRVVEREEKLREERCGKPKPRIA